MSEAYVRLLIYIHAAFGGVALLSGSLSIVSAKGTRLHKKGGKVFYYTMLCGALLSLIISMQPHHLNYFLFVIGIFSTYMILSGKRILKLKLLHKSMQPGAIDYSLPIAMLAAAIVMLGYGVFLKSGGNSIGVVLMVFGGIGALMAIGDLRLLRSIPADNRFWLYQHITKMTGGYIAAVTAFLVVNQMLPMLVGWLAPTVVGTVYIVYHQFRFRKNGERILAARGID